MPFTFDNSYARLPQRFYSNQLPTPVASPSVVKVNHALATQIGVNADALSAAILAGNEIPEGAEPIATAYAGHQFGGFSPQRGDGRAILLGEVIRPGFGPDTGLLQYLTAYIGANTMDILQ